jgi:hypothetical protein
VEAVAVRALFANLVVEKAAKLDRDTFGVTADQGRPWQWQSGA